MAISLLKSGYSSHDEPPQAGAPARPAPIPLTDYRPVSMLRVPETVVEEPRFPVIDMHAHLSWAVRDRTADEATALVSTPEALLEVMDRRGVQTMVNLTGGVGQGLSQTIARLDRGHPGRFFTFTEPSWAIASEPGYAARQADAIQAAHQAGARGLKVLKMLGLFLREGGKTGPLVAVDDPRFDPMWETCGALGIPVAIHVSDPLAFFLPNDATNERYEELYHHPDWSFHGADHPSHDQLMAMRDRVFARHPRTQFIGLHVGHCAENLAAVGAALDRFPNLSVDIAARIGELGRQPRTAARFFDRYQDRIVFGTDATPNGTQTPQQLFGDDLYRIYYRFLETEDEYFDYAPAPVPPQGRWKIYGLGLKESVLRKVYTDNARRLLRLSA